MSTWDMTSNLLGAKHPIGVRGQLYNPKFSKRTDGFFLQNNSKVHPSWGFTKRFWSSMSFDICFGMSVEKHPRLASFNLTELQIFGKWFYDLSSKFPQRILLKFKTVPWNMLLEEHIRMFFYERDLGHRRYLHNETTNKTPSLRA